MKTHMEREEIGTATTAKKRHQLEESFDSQALIQERERKEGRKKPVVHMRP